MVAYTVSDMGLRQAKAVAGAEYLYETVRDLFGRQFSKQIRWILLSVVFCTLFLPFGFFFRTMRKKLAKRMKREMPGFKTAEEYAIFKRQLAQMQSFLPDLKRVTNYNLSRAPWPARLVLREMQKISSTLITYTEWYNSRLSKMNTEQFATKNTHFRFTSERELWNNRNPAYEYWM